MLVSFEGAETLVIIWVYNALGHYFGVRAATNVVVASNSQRSKLANDSDLSDSPADEDECPIDEDI